MAGARPTPTGGTPALGPGTGTLPRVFAGIKVLGGRRSAPLLSKIAQTAAARLETSSPAAIALRDRLVRGDLSAVATLSTHADWADVRTQVESALRDPLTKALATIEAKQADNTAILDRDTAGRQAIVASALPPTINKVIYAATRAANARTNPVGLEQWLECYEQLNPDERTQVIRAIGRLFERLTNEGHISSFTVKAMRLLISKLESGGEREIVALLWKIATHPKTNKLRIYIEEDRAIQRWMQTHYTRIQNKILGEDGTVSFDEWIAQFESYETRPRYIAIMVLRQAIGVFSQTQAESWAGSTEAEHELAIRARFSVSSDELQGYLAVLAEDDLRRQNELLINIIRKGDPTRSLITFLERDATFRIAMLHCLDRSPVPPAI